MQFRPILSILENNHIFLTNWVLGKVNDDKKQAHEKKTINVTIKQMTFSLDFKSKVAYPCGPGLFMKQLIAITKQ